MRRGVALLSLLVGCAAKDAGTTAGGAPHAGAPSSSVAAPAQDAIVRIDPSLLVSGRVVVAPVVSGDPSADHRWPGQVESNAEGRAEAGTLVAGRVVSLEVDVGTVVRRGQVLAWIEAPDVVRAVADVLRARARADVGRRKLERQLVLLQQEATSKNAVDEARAESAVADADLAAARTLLANLGGVEPAAGTGVDRLGVRVAVRAPLAGVVTRRDVVLGGAVSPDRELFEIVAAGHAFVRVRVPEMNDIPPNDAAVTLVSRGSFSTEKTATCAGKVTADLGIIDDATRTHAIRVEATAACALLTPGRYVDVVPALSPAPGGTGATTPALLVPHDAVVEVRRIPVVFVASGPPGTFVVRAVAVRPTGGLSDIVDRGLSEGDRVVTRGALLLKGELLRAELAGE